MYDHFLKSMGKRLGTLKLRYCLACSLSGLEEALILRMWDTMNPPTEKNILLLVNVGIGLKFLRIFFLYISFTLITGLLFQHGLNGGGDSGVGALRGD